ncbi:MAG: DUF1553 domain-containing protein [Gemmataceae bacterium]
MFRFRTRRFAVALFAILAHRALIQADETHFERDVLPNLTKQCLGCHGGLRQKGGLDLRTPESMKTGGKSGPAAKPGEAEKSLLWTRIETNEMPPGERKLSAEEKQAIRKWIAGGMPTSAEKQKKADPLLPSGSRHEPKQVATAIDQHIDHVLSISKLKAIERTDESAFLRRVYLDLAGKTPTAKQAAEFLDSQDADKRSKLIDQLLASADFGEQMGRTRREWVCPPELHSDGNGGQQPFKQSQDLGKWIGTKLNAGDRWDRIVASIVAAEGDIKNNPQVIFFGLVGEGGRPTPSGSARAVASLFMGVQLQCAECHDDPYRAWAQKEHWALAAFFGKTSGDFNKINEPATGKNDARISIPKSAFKNVGSLVPAAFPDGKSLVLAKDSPLRPHFAQWLTAKENTYFAPAFANRLWFYFFSRGIVHPIDDFRELNPPSHPGLMKLLANEFADSGFDVKHLVRCICNSEAYQRSSKVPRGADEPDIANLTSLYGRMPMRVMNADVLYDSLKLAYGDPKLDLRTPDLNPGNTNGESAAVKDQYLEFLRRFGTNEEDATDFTHGIPQMLTMINHPRLLKGSKALDEHLKTKSSQTEAIDWLYLTTLSRRPSAEERTEAQRYLESAPDIAKGYVGVLWSLVNRSEYMLIR